MIKKLFLGLFFLLFAFVMFNIPSLEGTRFQGSVANTKAAQQLSLQR